MASSVDAAVVADEWFGRTGGADATADKCAGAIGLRTLVSAKARERAARRQRPVVVASARSTASTHE
jgi:hypothetical protein